MGTIRALKGETLRVRLIDDLGVLAATRVKGPTPGAHVLIGVWSANGLFQPMRVRSKGPVNWDHDLVVPAGTPLQVTVSSKTFDLTDDQGARVDRVAGARVPIQVTAGNAPPTISFRITGQKPGR